MTFFQLQAKDKNSRAKAGIINTLHGPLETPMLMTVGTKATVKSMTPAQLKEIGVPVVLCNTYHLHINPGENLIAEMGGLHKFMNWDGPIFTDSGGFQIFIMGHGLDANETKCVKSQHREKSLQKITEEGAKFRSYFDGSIRMLTPENSIQIQHKLGADMIVVLDECTPYHKDKKYTKASMEMTHRWLLRSQAEHKRLQTKQALYGVIQGGVYPDLRKISTEFVAKADLDGICIGGSLGKDKQEINEVLDMVIDILPEEKPVHFLGVGADPTDLIEGVERGMDTFDCVAFTRNARHGMLYSSEAKDRKLRITNAAFRHDDGPIDPHCDCYVCQNFSRAYVHYLIRAHEFLGIQLATYHNIYYMIHFMKRMRQSILEGEFQKFRKAFWEGKVV